MEPPNFHLPISDWAPVSLSFAGYLSLSIRLVEVLGCPWVLKVSVNGHTVCCKITNEAIHEPLSQEYSALQKILNSTGRSTPSNKVRMPVLAGVVESHKGDLVGILMDYIPHTLRNLEDTLKRSNLLIRNFRRAKQATQIEQTLQRVHAAGVVWGDAKTSNILIDENDDAYIVDFGGGQTWSWVETELVCTMEGDFQALRKIQEALHV